jgi:hypothetical protein
MYFQMLNNFEITLVAMCFRGVRNVGERMEDVRSTLGSVSGLASC